MSDPWNRDQWGLICKLQTTGVLDGGDTAANCGTYIFCKHLLGEGMHAYAKRTFDLLEYQRGHWRRHPNVSRWYAQPGLDRWSRDQSIPIICAMAMVDYERARDWYENHRTRWFLYMPNNGYKNGVYSDSPGDNKKKWPDPTFGEYFSLLIRACKFTDKYWMLKFLDFELLIGSYFRRWFSKDRDIRNHVLSVLLANRIQPTWASRRAAKVLPKSYLIDTITYWFRDRSSGEPPMHEVMVPVIEKYL